MSRAPTRAVFFDVDDTLVDFAAAARQGLIAAVGTDVSYDEWLTLSAEHYPRYTRGEVDFQTMRTTRMAELLDGLGRDGSGAADIEARRISAMEATYALFPDALPTVAEMRRRGLLVGLITNNEGQHQRRKLQLTGLAELFDEVVISGEVGVAKPAAEIFELACARMGVSPAAAVHVGDRLRDDALGATAAGLQGVWLARPEVVDPVAAAAQAEAAGVPMIHGLEQLAAVLDPALITVPARSGWHSDQPMSDPGGRACSRARGATSSSS